MCRCKWNVTVCEIFYVDVECKWGFKFFCKFIMCNVSVYVYVHWEFLCKFERSVYEVGELICLQFYLRVCQASMQLCHVSVQDNYSISIVDLHFRLCTKCQTLVDQFRASPPHLYLTHRNFSMFNVMCQNLSLGESDFTLLFTFNRCWYFSRIFIPPLAFDT